MGEKCVLTLQAHDFMVITKGESMVKWIEGKYLINNNTDGVRMAKILKMVHT